MRSLDGPGIDMDALKTARQAWPELHVDDDELAGYLAERPDARPEHLGDLYLACACARGDERALRAFEAAYFGEVDAAWRRLRTRAVGLDEARQAVRERLFLRRGGPPRIASWSGAGPLRTWLRVLATRALLDQVRAPRRELPIEDMLLETPLEGCDPELALLKERCRPRIRAALAAAFARLDARQRLLLRVELEGGALADVARSYGVHLRSVQRWLRDTREQLLAEFRRALGAEPDGADIESLVVLMHSQIACSIASLVGA